MKVKSRMFMCKSRIVGAGSPIKELLETLTCGFCCLEHVTLGTYSDNSYSLNSGLVLYLCSVVQKIGSGFPVTSYGKT